MLWLVMAQSVTQLSDSRWAEDNPAPLPPSSVSLPPSLSVLLTSPIPRCNDTAEGFFSHVTWPELQRADAGERNPADSARARQAQPSLNQQQQKREPSLIAWFFTPLSPPFSFLPFIYPSLCSLPGCSCSCLDGTWHFKWIFDCCKAGQ